MGKKKSDEGGSGGILAALDAWDKRVSYSLYLGNSAVAPIAKPICKILELSGNGFFWLAGGMIGLRHDPTNAYFWVNLYVCLFIDLAVAGVVKGIFRRDRPEYSSNKNFTFAVDRFSFPSGHTMRMTSVACLCNRMLPLMAVGSIPAGGLRAAVISWSAIVAASRVTYGRHHLLDVVAGVAVGVLEYRLHVGSLWVPIDTAVMWQANIAQPVLPIITSMLS